ncbi:MAG: hypothetical protein IVW55_03690 [Chloroflexi bacterium]|nr:hypothetical protein [Chloroflexota bacterium]
MTANTENSGNTETKGNIEVIGRMFVFDFGPSAIYQLHFVDKEHREVTVMADAAYPPGTLNKFDIEMTQLRPNVYLVTWVEPATVTR